MATSNLVQEKPTYVQQTKQPSIMKRFFRKFLWISVMIIGLFILFAVVVAAFFEDTISQRLLKEINKSLKTELTVNEFELSLLSGFPKASANLNEVILKDTKNGNLLEAANISFRFGLFSLFSSTIKVHSVVISNGALYVAVDKKGVGNFDVLKSSDNDSEASSSFSISLQEAILNHIDLIYTDEQNEQDVRFMVNDALFSGEFASDRFSLASNANIETNFVDIEGTRFLAGKTIDYDATIDVDLVKSLYNLQDVKVGVESNEFQLNGTIETQGLGTDFDLNLTAEDGSVESVVQLLPEEYLAYVGDFQSTGTFLFNSTIKGRFSPQTNPAINVNFGLRDGRISSPRLDNSLKDVSFNAIFTNGKYKTNKSSFFEMKNFKAYFNRELTESYLKVSDLSDPKIDFKIDGSIPLGTVYGLFNMPTITDGDGEVEFKNIAIDGRLSDMQSVSRIYKVSSSGELEFDDAELTINEEDMIVDRGKLILENNNLKVDGVKIEGAGSEIILDGNFNNLIPVLFADSLNSKDAELQFKANLDADKMDLARLISLTETPVEEDEVSEEVYDSVMVAQTQERERLTKFLKGTFDANIKEFTYNKINGEAFDGSLSFDNNEMEIDGDVVIMDGTMNVEGKVYFEDKPRLKANLIFEEIDANQFFYQCENFGQSTLTSDNLRGDLNSHMTINAYWDEKGAFLDEKLRVLAGISIKDGELRRFKMLEEFSNYINVKDLRNIKLVNMQNWLEVRKGKIYLPVMFIQSNALNLTMSGEHSFEHDMDYALKINAGQVLFNKFKKHDPRLKPQKAKKKGWFNLYYRITGNLDDYDTRSSKRQVQQAFVNSDRHKKEIRRILEKEFGAIQLLNNEPESWRDVGPIPEYEEEDGNLEYLDEITGDGGR